MLLHKAYLSTGGPAAAVLGANAAFAHVLAERPDFYQCGGTVSILAL
jgi:hypothetical protein